jgi:hypothetical protein
MRDTINEHRVPVPSWGCSKTSWGPLAVGANVKRHEWAITWADQHNPEGLTEAMTL